MSNSEEYSHLVKPEELPEGVTLRDHVYDGIQEYDQKLPNWWLVTFYGAVIFFVGYWFSFYQLSLYKTDQERIDARIDAITRAKQERLESELEVLTDERFWEMSRDAQIVAAGKGTFQSTCLPCHGPDLSGMMGGAKLPGLPLNDTEWKYGGKPMEVMEIVINGSPDKASGMQAWEPILGATKVAEVVAYVLSYHEPPGP